jgi:hypothetical protein
MEEFIFLAHRSRGRGRRHYFCYTIRAENYYQACGKFADHDTETPAVVILVLIRMGNDYLPMYESPNLTRNLAQIPLSMVGSHV